MNKTGTKILLKQIDKEIDTEFKLIQVTILNYFMDLATELLLVHPDLANTIRRFVSKKTKEWA